MISTSSRARPARNSSRLTWSMTTASAAARNSHARTVSSPTSPGPAPTKTTRAGSLAVRTLLLVVLVVLVVGVVLLAVGSAGVVERVGLTRHAPVWVGLGGTLRAVRQRGRRVGRRPGSPRLGL